MRISNNEEQFDTLAISKTLSILVSSIIKKKLSALLFFERLSNDFHTNSIFNLVFGAFQMTAKIGHKFSVLYA